MTRIERARINSGSSRSNDSSVARSPVMTASTADSNRKTGEPSRVTASTYCASAGQLWKLYHRAMVSWASPSSGAESGKRGWFSWMTRMVWESPDL